jgi:hypothetical protein
LPDSNVSTKAAAGEDPTRQMASAAEKIPSA